MCWNKGRNLIWTKELLFEQSSIVILMFKSLKLKFSEPLETKDGYTSIGLNKDRIWFEISASLF